MDFITRLPRFHILYDSIWMMVDRLTKSTHFLSVKTTNLAEDYAKLYIQEAIRLHGFPISIISNIGAHFTAQSLKSYKKG